MTIRRIPDNGMLYFLIYVRIPVPGFRIAAKIYDCSRGCHYMAVCKVRVFGSRRYFYGNGTCAFGFLIKE